MARMSYEIRVSGLVPEEMLDEFEDITATVMPVETVLQGPVADQAALHGILIRLQSLGLSLVEVRRLLAEPRPQQAPRAVAPPVDATSS